MPELVLGKMTIIEIDPHQQAQNITPGGSRPDTLTLELPVQKPDVAVPVVELLMK